MDLQGLAADSNLYILKRANAYLLLLVYVDDLLLASNSPHLMTTVKKLLSSEFEMSELGEPRYMLGVQIRRYRSHKTISISQAKYAQDVLARFGMSEAHGTMTPLTVGLKLERMSNMNDLPAEEKAELDKIPYKQAVGSLIYLACLTRPDLAFAVHMVSQHLAAYSHAHWKEVKRILRYVKETEGYSITYKQSKEQMEFFGYSDSDWASDPHTRKSVGAYLFLGAYGLVSWACKKHLSICLSSMEAEYKSLTAAAKEAVWDRQCLFDIGQKQVKPTRILCDNMGAIALANNPVFHSRRKHIAIYYHYIREVVAEGSVAIEYVNTIANLADALTKALPADTLLKHCVATGLCTQVKQSPLGTEKKKDEKSTKI